ncbi:bifunctional adenosylcobinamide kinase/adenosylcobinamide-phosphate guanylyltransferase [Thalassolituus sp. C2-1]|uniref:bifunctional adenosylcobinamide kinase/adenosylcobinamide-phosphate guanylyltransferase n=1 Tax=Venatorbacter sp. C2-1 TaxID=2597518 RepID=UPI001196B74D|nr:bifunctional adenosylcobinamide kinase/adenosylcobinamide-phosphate guanylyltransferase [Thalassolituus sp. C2-1]TVV45579.1 bifunctional adenosylcobinamide kinase/adenosylcobinamide-phosphate guanylyltransferase [Thalassolituus sp. C2-1]
MNRLELILGGARSGKSRYGEAQAEQLAGEAAEVVYIATAQALDGEMQQRIIHHREQRPVHWLTLEEPWQLAAALQRVRKEHPAAVILVDCLTLWLTNCLLSDQNDYWERQKAALMDELQQLQQPLLLVSNEVGYGIVPMGELSRRFVDEAGRLHQDIARLAHDVTLVVAGIPMAVKRS